MKKIIITVLFLLSFGLVNSNTQASTISLNFNYFNADHLIGTITPGSPSNINSEAVYLNQLLLMDTNATATIHYKMPLKVQTYVRSDLSVNSFPGISELIANKVDTESGPLINIGLIDYIIARYDDGKASAVWYVGDLAAADKVQLPTKWGEYNISNYSTWKNINAIPEPHAIFLLGIGLISIAGIKRKLR